MHQDNEVEDISVPPSEGEDELPKRQRLEDGVETQPMLDIMSMPTESRVSVPQDSDQVPTTSTESRALVDAVVRANREDSSRSLDRHPGKESEDSHLLENWNKTGTTGRGIGILERKRQT